MHIRLVNMYLLNVPIVSSPYFNKIKRTSHLGKWHALPLEILRAVQRNFLTGILDLVYLRFAQNVQKYI